MSFEEPKIWQKPEAPPKKGEEVEHFEFSKEEEKLAKTGEAVADKKMAEAKEILAEKKEITSEEKAEAIRRYVGSNYIEITLPFILNKKLKEEEGGESLRGLSPEKLRKSLREQDSELVFRLVDERDQLKQQMAGNGVDMDRVSKFVQKNGEEMLPRRIQEALSRLNDSQLEINSLFRISLSAHKEEEKETATRYLKDSLTDLRRENQEWQKYAKFEREKEEKPMEIRGFEKLDLPHIKGNELLRIAAKMLPRGIFSTNVKSIEYSGRSEPINKARYGFDGESAASFVSDDKFEKGDIVFYRTRASGPMDFWNSLPFVLGHEWGHSLDPRLVDQTDLSPGEQFKMVEEWEKVRSEEEEWSSYVKKISNQDKEKENLEKSKESFAESAAKFLNNPYAFKQLYPKRYEFGMGWLKKRFPEFDPERHLEAKELYTICLFGFPREEREASAIKAFLEKSRSPKKFES